MTDPQLVHRMKLVLLNFLFIVCYGQDTVQSVMCSGVNIYNRNNPVNLPIFGICPDANEIKEFLKSGKESGRIFQITKLDGELKQQGTAPKTLALGFKEFEALLWDSQPTPTQMAPYDSISSGYRSVGLKAEGVRNMLMFGNDPRVLEYKRRGESRKDVEYVVPKSMVSERFRVEWMQNPTRYHLSSLFKQRVSQLTSVPGSIDAFIRDFGSHYRRSVTFGGVVGADFYFSGYGTIADKKNAVQHALSEDIRDIQKPGYKPTFEGFNDSPIEFNFFYRGGSNFVGGFDAWLESVDSAAVPVKEELWSMIELLEATGYSNIWQILDRFEDRVAYNSRNYMKGDGACLFVQCPEGTTCMGTRCAPSPPPPRWPNSVPFCIPKPVRGSCPSPSRYDEFTDDTWVFWDTENGPDDGTPYKGADHVTGHGLHPDKLLATIETKQNGGIQMYYCCLKNPTSRGDERTKWPAGNYCLYAYQTLSTESDRAWAYESILWNDEDRDNRNTFSAKGNVGYSEVPLGMYRKSYTEQKLMCRDDGDCNKPIVLPKTMPFYLVRNGGCCQEVFGMVWTQVTVTWDTESNNRPDGPGKGKGGRMKNDTILDNGWQLIYRICNFDDITDCDIEGNKTKGELTDIEKCVVGCNRYYNKKRDSCGNVGPDKVTMNFCYYEEKGTPSPTPFPSPSPTPPTRAPTTAAPTMAPPTPTQPPTPPPPTKMPTPYPTRPTPSPIYPTKQPTRSPTYPPPTPAPTPAPTPPPSPPTPPPTKNPTPSPTPAPTSCEYCELLQTVNIVGLNSIWPNDRQPSHDVFRRVPCECTFCTGCKVIDDCEIRYYMGDFLLLTKFWRDRPVELEADDTVFARITWQDNPDGEDYPNFKDLTALKKGTLIDLAHARNALLFGGSQRMQDYGRVYSTVERYIYTNHDDRIFSPPHLIPRSRRKEMAEGFRTGPPILDELTTDFRMDINALIQAVHTDDKEKARMFETFIYKFGTHYIWRAQFGAMYGADYYFTGYGTKPEMIMGMRDVRSADVARDFEHYRLKEVGREASSGRSFVRAIGGNPLVGPEVKGWMMGGDPYGVRSSSGHAEWAKHLDMGENTVIIHHKQLRSMANLFALIPITGVRDEQVPALIENCDKYFRERVVDLAYLWLQLHYYCFFLDTSCENRRRHPFLREDKGNNGCAPATTSKVTKRQRTEFECCIGQEHQDSGYLLKSETFPFETVKWCKGTPDHNGVPSNFPPWSKTRRGNCPVVPPNPRWANFISFCLPKPLEPTVPSTFPKHVKPLRECPKEEYPEYEWRWAWEQYIFDDHARHDVYSYITTNLVFAGCTNINPTNEVYSMFPWEYELRNYEPRLNTGGNLSKNALNARPYAQFLKTYNGSQLPQKTDCYEGYCKYSCGYLEYPQYPVNRYYIRTQAPFLQEIGWAFWDTEDDTDDRDFSDIQVATHPTPTHLPVAISYKIKKGPNAWLHTMKNGETWNYNNLEMKEGGKKTPHNFAEVAEELNYDLWETAFFPSFWTGGTKMEYCCTTINEGHSDKAVHNLHWPDGHFCIYAHGAVDSTDYQFQQGSIGWDCENGANNRPKRYGNKIYIDTANNAFSAWDDVADQQRLTECLPLGLYHIQFDGLSEQYFSQNLLCTKTNLDFFRTIELPRDRPFYLMQYKAKCQEVRGMWFTAVSLTWYTEKDHITYWPDTGKFDRQFIELEMNSWGHATAFGRRDQIPDGHYSQKKIEVKYCYYQPNSILYLPQAGKAQGPQQWWERDPEKSNWKNSTAVLRKVAGRGMDILTMDNTGSYTIEWPVDESKSLCYGPTPSPTYPPTVSPTFAP